MGCCRVEQDEEQHSSEHRSEYGSRYGSKYKSELDSQAEAYERLNNIILSTQAQLWRSPTLRQSYARDQNELRALKLSWFPELEAHPPVIIDGLDGLTSFEMWHRLRHHQKLGVRESKDILTVLISGFFAQNGIETR